MKDFTSLIDILDLKSRKKIQLVVQGHKCAKSREVNAALCMQPAFLLLDNYMTAVIVNGHIWLIHVHIT